MSVEKLDTRSLKRAAIMSYVMGIGALVIAVAVVAVVVAVILPYSSLSLPEMSLTLQTFITILWVVIVVVPIAMVIELLFGYYNVKIGSYYDISSLKLSGISSMILSFAAIPLVIGAYEFISIIQLFVSSPPSSILAALMSIVLGIGIGMAVLIMFLLLGLFLAAVFGLIFIITFIIGLSNLKQQTGLSDFNIAMWLTIVGIFCGVTLPIGIIFYGRGLGKLARGEGTEKNTAQ